MTTPNTQILFFDGVDDLDPVGPLEILTAAGFPARPVRPAGHPAVLCTAHGLTLQVDDELDDAAELVIVPGGGWRDDAGGVRALADGTLPARLAALHAGDDARVVDDGDLVTCGGPSAGLDLGVHLVTRFLGERAGEQAAARLQHEPVGPVVVGAGALR